MDAGFSEDQVQFRDIVSRFLQRKSPPDVVRALMDSESGYDPAVWQQLSHEVGLAGIAIPDAYGGSGFGAVELGIATEEMGRYLYSGPFFASSVMATYALLFAATEFYKANLLAGIATGECIATLVMDSLNSPDAVGESLVVSEGKLSGTAKLVLDAQNADLLIVIASVGNKLGLFQLTPDVSGVTVTQQTVLDPTRKLSSIDFDLANVEQIGELDSQGLRAMWDAICVALAHEMIGGAQFLLDSTIEYTKLRVQFGRPIGSFQALKHRCADLLMELEFARAATHHAARCLDAKEGEPYLPAMVKAMASDVYMNIAKAAIQLRGGIGFTWENDTHLWFKRAKSSEVFMGAPYLHREHMMMLMEAEA